MRISSSESNEASGQPGRTPARAVARERLRLARLPYLLSAAAIAVACVVVLAGCGSTPSRGGGAPQPIAPTPAPVVIPEGDSSANLAARRQLALTAMASRPAEFLVAQPRLASDGEIYAAVRNRSAVPATGVKFVVAVVDRQGAIKEGPYEIDLGRQILQPSETVNVPTRLGPYQDPAVLPFVKFEIQAAQPLDRS